MCSSDLQLAETAFPEDDGGADPEVSGADIPYFPEGLEHHALCLFAESEAVHCLPVSAEFRLYRQEPCRDDRIQG